LEPITNKIALIVGLLAAVAIYFPQEQFLPVQFARYKPLCFFNSNKSHRFANSGEHQQTYQLADVQREHGKQPNQCADTFGAFLTKRAVFTDNHV